MKIAIGFGNLQEEQLYDSFSLTGIDAFFHELDKENINIILNTLQDCTEIHFMPKWYLCEITVSIRTLALHCGIKLIYHSSKVHEITKREKQLKEVRIVTGIIHQITGVQYEKITGGCKEQPFVFARFIFSHHLYLSGMKVLDIARYQHKIHTTIKHQLKKYKEEYQFNPEFRKIADKVKEMLNEIGFPDNC